MALLVSLPLLPLLPPYDICLSWMFPPETFLQTTHMQKKKMKDGTNITNKQEDNSTECDTHQENTYTHTYTHTYTYIDT